MLRKFVFLFLFSLVATYFQDAVRIFFIVLEGLPHLLLDHMGDWLAAGGIKASFGLAAALLLSTASYSSIILGVYWLTYRRLMLHYDLVVFAIWFMVLLVMTIGPQGLTYAGIS